MSAKGKTIQHIVAAKMTADIAQYHAVLQKMSRGTDAAARQTGRAWKGLGHDVDVFERKVIRLGVKYQNQMRKMTRVTKTETAQMRKSIQSVNFAQGGMMRGRQAGRAMPMMMGRGGSMLSGAAAVAGPWAAWNQMEKSRQFNERITDTQIKSGKDSQWGVSLEKQILRVSDATGKSKDEVLDYVQQFTELTGKADMAREALSGVSRMAVASGAPMRDLAGVVDQLSGSLGITDPKQLEQTMGILLQHERAGKVPFAALASQFGKVSSQGLLFGKAGQGVGAARDMSGLMQIAARGYGSGQEGMVATGSQRFLSYMAKNRKKVEKTFDVSLGSGSGKDFVWKSLSEVFKTVGEAVAKRPDLMSKHGGTLFGLQGQKVALQLGAAAQQGWGTSVGSKTAAGKFFAATGKGVVAKSYEDRQASVSARWNKAVTKMSNNMHRYFLPVLEQATDLLPEVGKALKFMLDNSSLLIKLWLGAKGAALFRTMGQGAMMGRAGGGAMMGAGMAMGGMGGGGGSQAGGAMPGSDLAMLQQEQAVRRGRRRQMAMRGVRVAGSAAALAPFAVEMGEKLAEMMAGTTRAAIKRAYKSIDEQAAMTGRFKKNRLAAAGIGDSAGKNMDWWYDRTAEGAQARVTARKALGALGGETWEGGFGERGGAWMQGQWMKGRTINDLKGARGKLQTSYAEIYAKVQQQYEKRGGVGQISEKSAQQRAPILASLKTMMELTGRAIADGLNKRPITIHNPVTVTVSPVSNPGSRAAARATAEALRGVQSLVNNLSEGPSTADTIISAIMDPIGGY